MKVAEFLSVLKNNQEKELVFEYKPTKFVGENYHITEIKSVTINSVDCGGKANSWQETVVQLWENPEEKGKRNYLKTEKALQIFDRVAVISPLLNATAIKFEYGNETFHTAQLNTFDFEITNEQLIVKLHSATTGCKANDVCGIEEETTQKELKNTNSCASVSTPACC